ncbi:hypothetical protein ASE92_17250 [Pedobacter sp. Leaf41]|uniref:hypothetical protein n=1 Tax=Pedobacter sp. Leaf41 TaxID=1736218 RepID=UPI000703882A|nr:hypothetical protein [Pedobacter sp. Leaf41]KQN32353.1 hypothetical protein ASE92_17250 [Pedobacter sp. Leaf41]
MTQNRNISFDKLFYKVATNQFSLEYLEEVQSFYPEYLEDDSDEIKFKCEDLISAIYFMNGMSDKSLEIDLELLKRYRIERCDTLLLRTAKTSAELKRTDDVFTYIVRFLKDTHKDDDWSRKLPLLAWYVEFYSKGEDGTFNNFEQTLTSITNNLGIKAIAAISFSDRVRFIWEDFLRAQKELRAFHLAYWKAKKEQKDKLLEEYLRTETIAYFKTEIINTIKISESIKANNERT